MLTKAVSPALSQLLPVEIFFSNCSRFDREDLILRL